MSDNHSILNNEVIDNLVSVVNLEKRLNSTSYKEADLSLEKLKSICQELLLRLHPDKKGSSNALESDSSKACEISQFSKVLEAWKFLSKYSNEENKCELTRRILSRQYELIDKTTSAISKPLWKIIPLKSFVPAGKPYY